ncbi:MAG: TonB-dependent receptor, partial [Sphingomonadales bacterium]
MRRKTYTYILQTLLLGCVLTTYQTSFALEDIAEIVVTASRIEEPLSQVGSQVSILTNLEIKARQFTGVLEALGTMSGVTINQTGSFGGAASVRIRGAVSEQTLILIDNVEVNDTSSPGGGFDFSSLSLWDVEQIEVIKGPQSTLYGSDAIGGVINI